MSRRVLKGADLPWLAELYLLIGIRSFVGYIDRGYAPPYTPCQPYQSNKSTHPLHFFSHSFVNNLTTMAPGRLASPIVEAIASHPVESHDEHMKAVSSDIYGRYYPADPKALKLESNFGPMNPENVGYLQPTSADTPLEIMHERFQRDGYLFVWQCSLSNVGGQS